MDDRSESVRCNHAVVKSLACEVPSLRRHINPCDESPRGIPDILGCPEDFFQEEKHLVWCIVHHFLSLFVLCCFFNIPFAAYTFLALAQPSSFFVIGAAVVFEYFGYGFGFVGLILFMMQQIAPGKYKMAHYAFATSLMQFGFLIPSMVSGFVSDFLGYSDFFIWVMIATIPSFLITWFVPFRDTGTDEPAKSAAA